MHSALLLALAGVASAHFKLLHPESFHFEDSTEDEAPCGGKLPDFPDNDDDLFQYHVGGESIATVLTHERSDWLIRVTTDEKASGGWEEVFPIYTQSGLGKFCQPRVSVPSSYVGKTGIVSVVSAATDGMLYQCVLAKFVSGTGDEYSGCSNGSATGYFSSNEKLTALVSDDDSSSNDTSETSSSTGPEASESSESDNDEGAAMSLQAWGLSSTVVTVTAMVLLGGALLG